MAGRGPAPKDPDARARRNKTPETADLVADGELRGFPLPRRGFTRVVKTKVDGEWVTDATTLDWPEETRRWWLNWRKSAQAKTFCDSDWDFLLETAKLHAEFWLGDNSVANELRLRVAKFGATPEDRLRLRMKVIQPDAPEAPSAEESQPAAHTSRERYGNLRVVNGG